MAAISGGALATACFFQFFQWSIEPASSVDAARSTALPAVAARPTKVDLLDPKVGQASIGNRGGELLFERPAILRGIALEKTKKKPSVTRMHIVADRATTYRVDGAGSEPRLEIILESTKLRTPLPRLDLLDTPIRSFEARRGGNAVHLSLSLDDPVRVQSQWLEGDGEAILIVDLQSRKPAATQPRSPTAKTPTTEPTRAKADGPAPSSAEQASTARSSSLEIRPSLSDQLRREREAARALARERLKAARFARSQGELEAATRLYEEALARRPALREATLELAALLVEMGRRDDAIVRVREARRQAPRDAALTMIHARLLEQQGDLEAAIEMLDGSGLELTDAPEVHALSAAFVQKAGDHAAAIDRYERIVRQFPGEPSWWMGLAISLEAVQRVGEALEVYRIALQVGELPGPTRRWIATRVEALGEED